MYFSIVKNAKIFFSITIIFLLIGIGSMFTRGFNLGIDFTGGTIMDLEFTNPASINQVREVLKEHDLGNSVIQLGTSDATASESKSVLIRTGVISDDERRVVMEDMKSKVGDYSVLRVEQVGATVGNELVQQAVIAIVLSWVLMIIYITIRFEFKFAIAAIIALIIDVLVTLSWFSLAKMEMDSSFVAALLTVVGYSVNGTIVVFDRIRENLKRHRRSESLGDMVDNSIWQTMARSLYTVATSLVAVIAIFLFGGETIHNFSFAMMVGFGSGAYTSTLLAGPMWSFFKEHSEPQGKIQSKTKVV
ncbi:MAG: protein translocase subunit SecF [Acidaminococcaceae bacterium]|jgi:preprotein translocase subunit SecF|nr:protein translocase subunit SecF [Acidaminococcaceae bacterium]